jgi:preprotein translocase subunit SecD
MLKTRITAIILLALTVGAGFFVYKTELNVDSPYHFRLGLDLKGGTALTYKADVSKISASQVKDAMSSLREVIEKRVNAFGVSEPVVQVVQGGVVAGKDAPERLVVELPGVTDVKEAVAQIGKTPLLEFKLLEETSAKVGTTTAVATAFVNTGLTGSLLHSSQLEFNSNNQPTVGITFNEQGKNLFAKITRENIGKPLAIFLDGELLSYPNIREEIKDGKAQISGSFNVDTAKKLVRDLNYGSLPVPVELISTQTIGATLGAKVLNSGVRAGLYGFLIVALFLVLWYRLPGFVSVVSLVSYVVIVLTIFKIGISPAAIILFGIFFALALTAHWSFGILAGLSYFILFLIPGALTPVTITAAGIAGFILSMGIAVDANILIFERMKEELKAGRGLSDAIREGFIRAWNSIRDSLLLLFCGGLGLLSFRVLLSLLDLESLSQW